MSLPLVGSLVGIPAGGGGGGAAAEATPPLPVSALVVPKPQSPLPAVDSKAPAAEVGGAAVATQPPAVAPRFTVNPEHPFVIPPALFDRETGLPIPSKGTGTGLRGCNGVIHDSPGVVSACHRRSNRLCACPSGEKCAGCCRRAWLASAVATIETCDEWPEWKCVKVHGGADVPDDALMAKARSIARAGADPYASVDAAGASVSGSPVKPAAAHYAAAPDLLTKPANDSATASAKAALPPTAIGADALSAIAAFGAATPVASRTAKVAAAAAIKESATPDSSRSVSDGDEVGGQSRPQPHPQPRPPASLPVPALTPAPPVATAGSGGSVVFAVAPPLKTGPEGATKKRAAGRASKRQERRDRKAERRARRKRAPPPSSSSSSSSSSDSSSSSSSSSSDSSGSDADRRSSSRSRSKAASNDAKAAVVHPLSTGARSAWDRLRNRFGDTVAASKWKQALKEDELAGRPGDRFDQFRSWGREAPGVPGRSAGDTRQLVVRLVSLYEYMTAAETQRDAAQGLARASRVVLRELMALRSLASGEGRDHVAAQAMTGPGTQWSRKVEKGLKQLAGQTSSAAAAAFMATPAQSAPSHGGGGRKAAVAFGGPGGAGGAPMVSTVVLGHADPQKH